jgi:proteic killer suppression protein
MEIHFKHRKTQGACNSERESVRQWGALRARKIRQRLAELAAAETLGVIGALPSARLHELQGDRAGEFAVDVGHPFRLVFEPWHNPVPKTADGGIDKSQITAIRILSVEDYHGR